MRVLVVEDHPKLATAVATVLRREGMATDVAFDGHDALADGRSGTALASKLVGECGPSLVVGALTPPASDTRCCDER